MELNNADTQAITDQAPLKNPVLNQQGNLLIIIGVIFLLLVLGAGAYYLTKSQVTKTQPQVSTIPTFQPKTTVSPTPTGKLFSLTIPKETDWVKYRAQCPALKNNIEIYYPKTWFPKEFDTVGDMEDPENVGGVKDCQIIFGYAAIPDSYQTPGDVIASIRVETWLDPKTNFNDYMKAQIDGPKTYNIPGPKDVIDMTFNNQQFKAVEFEDSPDFYGTPAYILFTKKGDRFFRISPIGRHGIKSDQKNPHKLLNLDFDLSAQTISKEFLNRIKIL